MTRYQWFTIVTVIATLVLIAVGSTVRTTGSGLGCPDWPLCHGNLLPPMQKIAIIEWSHRTVAAIVGVLIVAQAFWTLRAYRADRFLSALAVASLPLLAIQAYLGRITVERELPAEVVAFHLFAALTLVALLALMAAFAQLGPERARIGTPERRAFGRVALAAGAVIAGVLVVGTYNVATDAGFACTAWPNCPEATIPFVDGSRLQNIHWLHRLTVLVGAGAIAWVYWHVHEMRSAGPALRRAANVLLGLYALQILIGAGNIWSDFAEAVLVGHLVGGSMIWALLVVIGVAGQFSPGAIEPAKVAPAPQRAGANA